MKFTKSEKHYKKACNYVPMGTSTFSKNPHLYTIGSAPLYVVSGKGSRIVDVDGNEFIDTLMGFGPIILGYCDPKVNFAVQEQLNKGYYTEGYRQGVILVHVAEELIHHFILKLDYILQNLMVQQALLLEVPNIVLVKQFQGQVIWLAEE